MTDTDDIGAQLKALRAADPPTHGGRVLSYVYDHGRPELDEVVAAAVQAFLPVNGLDPTTFTSVAVLERDLVAFSRSVTGGDEEVVGSVTSGGTESCVLAVKAARDRWLERNLGGTPTIVMPTTAHPAFRKAAAYLGLQLVEVPVSAETGTLSAATMLAAVAAAGEGGTAPALVVLSAPNYPFGVLDPIAEVAEVLADLGIWLHVDACIGGWLLPWWPGVTRGWDFRLPGVTSISTDLHKYGYAPKGASVVLYRGRENHRAQYFATAAWPGYPVVNPTLLGSRSATALAAAWAVTRTLGAAGYAELVAETAGATDRIRSALTGIEGLSLVGDPSTALLALRADPAFPPARQVDPFLLVDAVRRRGFLLQSQPALHQSDGTWLPRTAHLTLTPVSARIAGELTEALVGASNEVRGRSAPAPDPALVQRVAADGLPEELAGVMATLEALPKDQAPAALVGLLAGVIDPDAR
ncbi:pyridoxal phosphate-dependent decarboxylase family protein [Ruania zhangjianzhongii]|uniref:pyridoxal phosphate-dependent decarboxylase family protein n=1 Tax=Ruania zhangjianzhongii TaxID=2603206 RepID=UPI0011C9A8CC|nr:aminotransferase class I/II-fold pyridoxal phosphate-dependent enzyme [Ruania zhangjianzhongii]